MDTRSNHNRRSYFCRVKGMVCKVTRIIDLCVAIILAIFIISWASSRAGNWIGMYHPAAAPMTLHRAENVADVIVFDGASRRLWPQCSPIELQWHFGDRGAANAPRIVVNWGPPEKKPDGYFEFKGWIAEMDDVEQFKFNTYADVMHKCFLFSSYDKKKDAWTGGIEIPVLIRSRFWN